MNLKRHQKVSVPVNNASRHDLSHQHLTTLDFFRLQPIGCMECVAGDKISFDVRTLIEAAPLATKVYGSCHLDIHSFFVPFRLLWRDWNNYYYGDGSSDTFSLPSYNASNAVLNGLFNPTTSSVPPSDDPIYKLRRAVFGSLGYPTQTLAYSGYQRMLSLLPARAYQLVWWDWFRDSVNIAESTKASYIFNDGGDRTSSTEIVPVFTPRFRTFRKDYITTLLTGANAAVGTSSSTVDSELIGVSDGKVSGLNGSPVINAGGKSFAAGAAVGSSSTSRHILASLQIPALRAAAGLQRFLERLGISGTRPLERIKSTFGIQPDPERLDMSEFIGYKSIPIGIDGLINTGSSEGLGKNADDNAFATDIWRYDSVPYGQTTGRSSASGQTDTFTYHATEHGYILTVASVIPDYINGSVIDPLFTRGLGPASQGPIDFYQPDLDGTGYRPVSLGQLVVPNGKITGWDDTAKPDFDKVVGYQPYAEDYRFIFDRVSGDFNENSSLNFLRNMAFIRDLTQTLKPAAVVAGLNLTTPSSNDVKSFDNHFQVASESFDHFVLNCYFAVDAIRPVSSSELPTELSDMANRTMIEVDKNGIRS